MPKWLKSGRKGKNMEQQLDRIKIDTIKEINGSSYEEAVRVYEILHSPLNRTHFAHPYPTPENILAVSEAHNGMHVLVTRNEEDRVVATATLQDAPYPQNDNFIVLFGVDEQYQGKGYGRKMLDVTLDFAFTTPDHEGRERQAIHAAVVMGIDGWWKMYRLLRSNDFIPGAIWPGQFENGGKVANDVIRLFLQRKNYEQRTSD